MRVTGGVLKGTKLTVEKDFKKKISGLRPTSAKVREALFSIIGDRLKDAVFVDLYGGTGIVGLEAVSRGAAKVIINEKNKLFIRRIRDNIKEFNLENNVDITSLEAQSFLKKALKDNKRFDIIFADPPYQSVELEKILLMISKLDILNDNGILILEHYKKKNFPGRVGILELTKQYRYGDTMLTVYRKVK